MDFGIMGLDNLVCSNSQASNNGGFSLENGAEADKQKWYGSGFLKPEREENDDLRDFKMAKISLQRSDSSNFSEGHQQMLSFSSPNSQNVALPYYYQTSNAFTRNTGYGTGGISSSLRGPFTPSQWMELEHQALIYKYITANVPVPSYLLNPIRKALESVAFSTCFSGLRSNPLGWGGFHLGFSNTDPEPGRCRRTDGKKWRCSKDAVPDQKYCEKHINRGRHRSRKPVEAQSGHSANDKSASSISAATSATGVSNGLGSLQPGGSNNHPSGIPSINRSLLDKENTNGQYQQTTTILSMASPKVSSLNDHHTSYKESSRSNEFGLVCSDSLLNPLNTSLVNFTNYDHTHNLNNHDQIKSQNALRQFIDDWPKTRPHQSPTNENPTSSPLHISRELEMGLGVGTIIDTEQNQRQQTNWVPISWEPSVGGPLGEVLHNTSNNTSECSNAKALNLMEMLDNSPRLASSPTGVLQKGAFGSLSNSSAGSSPRGECSKTFDGASCSNGLAFGSVSKF